MDTVDGEGWPVRGIAGFWRRTGAFVVDGILLGIVGTILGVLFFDAFAGMGAYARLIGFAIALAYFGICNSRIGGGQTLGKRWLGVRVVDAHDQLLSLPRSLLRYTVLGIPFFANGLPIDPAQAMAAPLGYLFAFVVFGGMFAIVYLYIFNRRTRQSLHDLAVGSYVERFDRVAQSVTFPIMWRGHLAVVALLAAIALIAPIVVSRFAQTETFAGLLPLQQMLSSQPHVKTAQVVRGWVTMNGTTKHYLQSVLRLDASMTEDEAMAKRMAQQMAQADPDIAKEDAVVVLLAYGYDIGIASGWRKHGYSFKPDDLRKPTDTERDGVQ
ncbi:RDD family protein [Pseudolysobacter antarcticus]|uniref:RDD family protein n=1 Tax=Pseudolysobacter antarcticus TaxID=2511995 RepID=A0A411HKD6_9GAMM|nr:RDD family protein [Pseudolysobacter antarcticus]QBB70874.1 RDD family protein [Pseudolysobacter antarcticus]